MNNTLNSILEYVDDDFQLSWLDSWLRKEGKDDLAKTITTKWIRGPMRKKYQNLKDDIRVLLQEVIDE